MDEKPADENFVELFQQWLTAFEAVQAATCEGEAVAQREVLVDVESRIAATPAEGLRGLVVKLGSIIFWATMQKLQASKPDRPILTWFV